MNITTNHHYVELQMLVTLIIIHNVFAFIHDYKNVIPIISIHGKSKQI